MNQIEEHKKLVEFLHDVYVRKNHDYGDSFSRSFGKYGVTAALVRMEDKWNRLENLAGGAKQRVLDEGLRDTCLDLANYHSLGCWKQIFRNKSCGQNNAKYGTCAKKC